MIGKVEDMTSDEDRSRPTIIVITGPPAAGKSSLARLLGVALAFPVVSRDAIKSSLVRTEQPSAGALRRGGELAGRSFAAFAEVIDAHVDRAVSLVIEQSFERGKGEEFLAHFADRAAMVQVACAVSRPTSLARFARRMEDDAHLRSNPTDHEILEMMRDGRIDHRAFAPLDLDVTTHVLDCEDIGEPGWHRRVDELVDMLILGL